jgi:hypothetical protein
MRLRILTSVCLWSLLLLSANVTAGKLPNDQWQLLTVAYPPDRDVAVVLGGGERTLTSRGICDVKWKEKAALVEMELENLPAPAEVGWPGRQYVLWAIDSEKRTLNMGLVPLNDKGAKWKVQVPFRVFGLLVTAEQNPQAQGPSAAVALESLLPVDPDLVVPVFRVSVALAPQG